MARKNPDGQVCLAYDCKHPRALSGHCNDCRCDNHWSTCAVHGH